MTGLAKGNQVIEVIIRKTFFDILTTRMIYMVYMQLGFTPTLPASEPIALKARYVITIMVIIGF